MVKIYIASSFSLIPRIEEVVKVLEDAGHEIMVKWWTRYDLKKKFEVLDPDDFYAEPECAYAYERDFNGVMECDVLLFVADDKPRYYTGANVELGIALGNTIRCMSVGRLRNSALYYNVYRAKDMDDVLYTLEILEEFFPNFHTSFHMKTEGESK